MNIEKFDAVDIIRKKRDKQELKNEEINWFIDSYTKGIVDDEQMSSLAMAIFLNGMKRKEIEIWTKAMIKSGDRMNFSSLKAPTVDKHSTGGVGDKITLPLVPLVSVFGAAVPQLSGRGLGHTGGTLDKLESIPGWQAKISNKQMFNQLNDIGAVICAANDNLAPADKKLYALRDITGTVESIPLIASSIMSKKIAEGTNSLVLDVKVGNGAFMKNKDDAYELATTMVNLGKDAGVQTVALLTRMDTPLGFAIGNSIEVQESIDVLSGGGPRDIVDLTVALAEEMLACAGINDVDVALALKDGRAMDQWKKMIEAQGGDLASKMPIARHSEKILSAKEGYMVDLDALNVGIAAWRLGAGRARKEDKLQLGSGVLLHKKPGDFVRKNEPIMTMMTDTEERFLRVQEILNNSYKIAENKVVSDPLSMILSRVE